MSYRDNDILLPEEEIRELNAVLRQQRTYYRKLHYWNIAPLDVDIYYDNLKDWSRFKESEDTTQKDTDAGISLPLKVKALFAEKAKTELPMKESNPN